MPKVNKFSKGLNQDFTKENTQEGTTTYALNAISSRANGNLSSISNEESNVIFSEFPENYTIIGKKYIGSNNNVLFLVSNDEVFSEIGILNDFTGYSSFVNTDQLNFKLSNKIDCVFRLKKDSRRTIYFTDNINPPRIFDFDQTIKFKTNGVWNADKFNLFSRYDKIPEINKVEVLEGGLILSGSYSFAIQYLDADFNATEFITSTKVINIYNSDQYDSWEDIVGSVNIPSSPFLNQGQTKKLIKITFGNLSENYPYYRIAIITSNIGDGEINNVYLSNNKSIHQNVYVFNGNVNNLQTTTIDSVRLFNNEIKTAESIAQLDNRLLLGNIGYNEQDFFNLQKSASKIISNYTVKEIILNDLESKSNQKRETLNEEDVGYMPGEIYSFGINYIFNDNSISPTYHIPGKSPLDIPIEYKPGIYSTKNNMSYNNLSINDIYSENDLNSGYWGEDYLGNNLLNQQVRHHRFPTREESGFNLVENYEVFSYNVNLKIITTEKKIFSDENTFTVTTINEIPDEINFNFNIEVNNNNIKKNENITISQIFLNDIYTLNNYDNIHNDIDVHISDEKINNDNYNFYVYGLESDHVEENYTRIKEYKFNIVKKKLDSENEFPKIVYDFDLYVGYTKLSKFNKKSKIFGISFSNIEKPNDNIKGYYITKNKREIEDRTVLDTGIVLPTLNHGEKNFSSFGNILPIFKDEYFINKINSNLFGIISPEYLFNNNNITNADNLKFVKEFQINGIPYEEVLIEDVAPGTTYNSSIHSSSSTDNDGYSLRILGKIVDLVDTYDSEIGNSNAKNLKDIELINLKGLSQTSSSTIEGEYDNIYNVLSDNKIIILKTKSSINESIFGKVNVKDDSKNIDLSRHNFLRLYSIHKNIDNSYSNFKNLPYYKEHANPVYFNSNEISSKILFNGDSYIFPISYTCSHFYDIKSPVRPKKKKKTEEIIGAILIGGLAIAGSIFFPALIPVLGPIAGAALNYGLEVHAENIAVQNAYDIYHQKYKQGLNDTIKDAINVSIFENNVNDDQIQWCTYTINNIWFESNFNGNLRTKFNNINTNFLNPTINYKKNNND